MARKEEAMVELEIETLTRRLDRVEREVRRAVFGEGDDSP